MTIAIFARVLLALGGTGALGCFFGAWPEAARWPPGA